MTAPVAVGITVVELIAQLEPLVAPDLLALIRAASGLYAKKTGATVDAALAAANAAGDAAAVVAFGPKP